MPLTSVKKQTYATLQVCKVYMETASLQLTHSYHPPLYLIFQKEHSSIQIKNATFQLSLHEHLAIDSGCASLKQKFKTWSHRSLFHRILFNFSKTFSSWPSLIGLMNFLLCFCRQDTLCHQLQVWPFPSLSSTKCSKILCVNYVMSSFSALDKPLCSNPSEFFLYYFTCFPSCQGVTAVKAPLPVFWPAIPFPVSHQRFSQQNVMFFNIFIYHNYKN